MRRIGAVLTLALVLSGNSCDQTPATEFDLVSFFPAQDATDVGVGSPVIVGFTHDLAVDTVTPGALTLSEVASGGTKSIVSGQIAQTPNGLVFYPTQPLKGLTRYDVYLAGSLRSAANGETLGSDYSWSFVTAEAPANPIEPEADTTPPFVVETDPVSGNMQVSSNAIVRLTFSEPIASATVSSSSLLWIDDNGTAVPFTAPLVAPNKIELRPQVALKEEMTYTVRVLNTLTDVAGNALLSETTVRFKVRGRQWTPAQDDPWNSLHSGLFTAPMANGQVIRLNDRDFPRAYRINLEDPYAMLPGTPDSGDDAIEYGPYSIATDANSNVYVVWARTNYPSTGQYTLTSAYYSSLHKTWSATAVPVDTMSGYLMKFEAKIDQVGNPYIFWCGNSSADGSGSGGIYYRRYRLAYKDYTARSTIPASISPGTFGYSTFEVDYMSTTSGMLVSHAYSGTTPYVFAAKWNGSSWTAISPISTGALTVQALALANDGESYQAAILETRTSPTTRNLIKAVRFTGTSTVQHLTVEDSGESTRRFLSKLVLLGDKTTNRFHLFYVRNRTGSTLHPHQLYYAQYRPESGNWDDYPGYPLTDSTATVSMFTAATNSAGTTMVVYNEKDSTGATFNPNTVKVRMFDDLVKGWGLPVTLSGHSFSSVFNLNLSMTPQGKALLLFSVGPEDLSSTVNKYTLFH